MDFQCLVIDDEIEIAATTAEYFNMFDIKTAYATSYEEGIAFIEKNKVSLILLDINLGQNSGFEFCKVFRKKSDVPVLFISARTADDDVLTALNIGGDDYITKPYTLNILLAKVKTVLKRYESQINKEHTLIKESNVSIGDLFRLDYNYHQVWKEGKPIKLKEMEFRLLSYLIENKNRVISKKELFEKIWDDNFVGDGTLNVHIRHLREKLEIEPNNPRYIKTVWGIGYVFELFE